MEEWKEYSKRKLGDYILDIAAGPFGSNLKVECFVPQGFPIIDGANLKGFTVTDNVTKFVTEEKARSLYRSIAKRNDVVVTISGNVGQISYIPQDSNYEEYLVSQRQFRVTFDTSKVFVPYLVYYFHTKEGQHKILSFANQTGVPALAQPLKNFKNIDIVLPDISIQKKIASILKSLDDKIENNRKINENLEQQAQALFKSWFVDFEPFRDQPFVESELGMIPEGWRVEELGKLIETTSGGTPSRKIDNYYNNGSIYWVKSKELLDNFIINTEEKITDVAIKESSAKLLPSHSVLIAMYGATVGAIGITTKSMACNQAICALLPNQLLPYTFLYLFAKFSKIYLQNKAVGSAQQNISQIIIKSLKVSYNSNAIKRFNSIVEPLLTIIEKNAFESHCLSHLRDTLLPKLMNGELKIS